MLMPLASGKIQPETDSREYAHSGNVKRHWLPEHQNSGNRHYERCELQIGTGPRRSQVAKAEHEDNLAHPDAEKAIKASHPATIIAGVNTNLPVRSQLAAPTEVGLRAITSVGGLLSLVTQ